GINAFRAASTFIDRVTRELYETYPSEDHMFGPPISTFEATKKEPNVPNINTIPGEDVFYMDCRVLPSEDLNEILGTMKSVASTVEIETGATIELAEVNISVSPPATPLDSAVVVNLQKAVKTVIGIEAKPVGIGGGTCAAIFRKNGYPAAVWSTNEEMAHEPNEAIKIENLVNDAKIFALLCMS
ncbi:MAG: M20/M25/M40 family metallo-hydrolase, partial [Thermoplasmata archaeon]|nr:M20/M25/M40 family metallo-hydrolase [Thermoplasmata archaeon]